MRTIKKVLAAIVLGYALVACEKAVDDPLVSRKQDPGKGVNGSFEVSYFETNVVPKVGQGRSEISMQGDGTLNILGSSRIQLEHDRIIRYADEQEYVYDGSVVIFNEDGLELRGIYSCVEQKSSREFQIPVEVTGGTGELVKAYGNLSIVLRLHPGEISDEHFVEVTGTIFLAEAEEFPSLI